MTHKDKPAWLLCHPWSKVIKLANVWMDISSPFPPRAGVGRRGCVLKAEEKERGQPAEPL